MTRAASTLLRVAFLAHWAILMTLNLQGFVAPGFERVRDEFIANFSRQDAYQEVGASLAVYSGGDCIIDLSAGLADRQGQKPWLFLSAAGPPQADNPPKF